MSETTSRFSEQSKQKQFEEHIFISEQRQQRVIFFLLTIMAVSKFVFAFFENGYQYLLYDGLFIIYTIVQFILQFRAKILLKKIMNFITCCLLNLFQLQAFESKKLNEIFTIIPILIVFQLTIQQCQQFWEVSVQTMIFVGIRIWKQLSSKDDQIASSIIVYQIIVGISIVVHSYFTQVKQKKYFLSLLEQNKMFQFMPHLVQNQFILFNFDAQKSCFQVKINSQITLSCWEDDKAPTQNLRSFLKNYELNGQKLEYLLRDKLKQPIQQQYDQSIQEDLVISNENHDLLNIIYSEIQLDERYFLIMFQEKKMEKLEEVKNDLINYLNYNKNLTVGFLRKQLFLINSATNKVNIQANLSRLKLHYLYFLGQFTQINSFQEIDYCIQTINLTLLVKQIVLLYKNAYDQIYIDVVFQDIKDLYIVGNEEIIQTFFLIICQLIVRFKVVDLQNRIILGEGENQKSFLFVLVQTECLTQLKSELSENPLFNKILRRLCPTIQIKQKNESLYFQLYKNCQTLEDIRGFEEEII